VTPDDRVSGSFRDPSGYVFWYKGRLLRCIGEDCRETLKGLSESGLLAKLMAEGLVVPSRFVTDAEDLQAARQQQPGFAAYLEHEVIEPISYPYEWTVSMLADAALLTLDLQLRLMRAGYALKDATAFNIQFSKGAPVFIDLPSIERPKRMDIWYALGQFQRMFLYPLLLCRHYGWDVASYFLPRLDGRGLQDMQRILSPAQRWHPRLWMDISLPLLLEKRMSQRAPTGQELLNKSVPNTTPQAMTLRRLRSKIESLASGYRRQGAWAQYEKTCTYSATATNTKKDLVRQYLRRAQPKRVLDLGCNTGEYTFLAAECGARVLAVDADHDAVDVLYGRIRGKRLAATPLVVNICQPTPGIGYLNQERTSFLDRGQAECVIALALLHHLLVSGNLPLAACRDLLARLTTDSLVLEFVPTDDPMFQQLTKYRTTEFDDVTLNACLEIFSHCFEIESVQPVPDLKRHLLFLRKRKAC
jgi:SAM-dependent methyltransferase